MDRLIRHGLIERIEGLTGYRLTKSGLDAAATLADRSDELETGLRRTEMKTYP